MPRPLAGCSETLKCFNEALQRFRIYASSYELLQRFIEALSNLMRLWYLTPEVSAYTVSRYSVLNVAEMT